MSSRRFTLAISGAPVIQAASITGLATPKCRIAGRRRPSQCRQKPRRFMRSSPIRPARHRRRPHPSSIRYIRTCSIERRCRRPNLLAKLSHQQRGNPRQWLLHSRRRGRRAKHVARLDQTTIADKWLSPNISRRALRPPTSISAAHPRRLTLKHRAPSLRDVRPTSVSTAEISIDAWIAATLAHKRGPRRMGSSQPARRASS